MKWLLECSLFRCSSINQTYPLVYVRKFHTDLGETAVEAVLYHYIHDNPAAGDLMPAGFGRRTD